MKIWGRWSEIVEVKLPDIIWGSEQLEKMLSINVLDRPVIRVGRVIYGKILCDEIRLKYSEVFTSVLHLIKSILKSPKIITDLFSDEIE